MTGFTLSILIAWFSGSDAPVWLYAYEDHATCAGLAEIIPNTACVERGGFPARHSMRPVARPADLCHPAPCVSVRPAARAE